MSYEVYNILAGISNPASGTSDKYAQLYQTMLMLSPEEKEEVVEKAVEQLREEVEEVVEEMPQIPEESEVAEEIKPDMDKAIRDLKEIMSEGFDNMAHYNSDTSVQELLFKQLEALNQIKNRKDPEQAPIEVKVPEPIVTIQKEDVPPIKSIKVRDIQKDARGSIVGLEFEVIR